jgi:hypothetical protein
MATLVEFRAQYPQYNDMPDVALANALHEKFYADMPKSDFYKSIALSPAVFIPENEKMITLPKAERSMQDTLMGYAETPAIIAGNIGRAITTPVARMFGEAMGGYGTPQGKQAGEQAAKTVSSQFYQPRTETGPEVVGQIGNVLGAIPPTPLTSAGTALSTLAPTATNQLRNIVVPATRQATAPVTNVLANAMQRQPTPAMQGMGAAETSEQLMREERLQRLNIPATAGERTKSLAQQQFEADVGRGVVTGIAEEEKIALAERMRKFKANQKQAITNNFERMTQEVGAEVADPTMTRQVGKIVDKALNDEYTKKFDNYKSLYKQADEAGETLQEVPYQSLLDHINSKTATMRQKLDPILDSVAESLAMNDPNKTGTISIRALEDIYQQIGQVKNSPNAGELKKIITNMGEGAGGEMYQAARQARSQLAKEFEDVSRVDKLLSTKAGYPQDRRIAFDDVFKHTVIDGSLEEMRTVTTLLKKAGPEGRQAYAELQGQTLQYMKDLLTKGDELSFKNLNTFIKQLDSEDKLTYMYGKTGRDQIMDLRDAIKDVVVKEPGAVNYPNTAGAVLRGLEALQAVRVPGAKSLAEMSRTREVTKKVESALKQPNKLAPSQSSRNSLAP